MIKLFGKKYPIRDLIFLGGEGLFLFLSLIVALVYYHGGGLSAVNILPIYPKLLLMVVVYFFNLYYSNFYTVSSRFSYMEMATRLALALGGTFIFLEVFYFVSPALLPDQSVSLAGLLIFGFLSSLWRYAYCLVLKKGWWTTRVLIVGSGAFSKKIIRELRVNSECAYRVTAVVLEDMPVDDKVYGDVPVFYSFSRLCQRAKEIGAEEIIVAMDQRRGRLPIDELLACKMSGVPIVEGETFYEELAGKILVDKINPSWLIFREGFQKSWAMMASRRFVSICVSAFGLFLSLPIILLTSILIKFDSQGPIFYRQERVGKDGKTFSLIKFRSMRQDAERDGVKCAKKDDARVTRVGKIIRKFRIDEIPQMWNVLKGEMSFVGPRPERPPFVNKFKKKIPYYHQRHTVLPGITGWAQINYPYGDSDEDAKKKLEYDLYYIKHMSVILDLYIIFKTIKIVLFREGSR